MKFYTLKGKPQFKEALRNATKNIWPKSMVDSILSNPHWQQLEILFPEYQIILVNDDEEIIGFGNTIPFYWEDDIKTIPDQGWDWLIQKGIEDYKKGRSPNMLGGIQIAVNKSFQGKGYSKKIITQAKSISKAKDFLHILIPVRPSLKHKFQNESIEEYLTRKEQGQLYDPWLRTHLKSGAEILKICSNSMTIPKPLREWEKLFGSKITTSGQYHFEGLLNSVDINLEEKMGLYIEPNVWVCY